MIRDAQKKDEDQIYSLWKNSYLKNNEALDCFFQNAFHEGKTIICEQDDKLVAALFLNEMTIMFHNKYLKAGFLSHTVAHPDYRKMGVLDEVIKSALDECEKKELFTFVEATSYKFWENYGFQSAVTHRYYELNERHFENVAVKDVWEDASAEELKSVYDSFMKLFDGYKVRTLHDFEQLLKQCEATHERILITRHKNEVKGYIHFYVDHNHVKVKELIYLGSNAFLRLCKAALAQHDLIILELSEAEHIEKLFPLAIPRKRVSVMVRCNNLPLFNKLFNSKVKTSKDAYALAKKPKFMNEKY